MELKKSQTQVAKILGVSQPTVNYRYRRARERMNFMEMLPQVSSDEIRTVLMKLGARDKDVEAMVLYVETNSQSEVARKMGTSQGAVRHWIHRALVTHLQNDLSEDPTHRRVRAACGLLVNKPGIFNEPQKPGETNNVKQVEIKLNQRVKVTGPLVPESRVIVSEGLYAQLPGMVLEVNPLIKLKLELESLHVTLVWTN
jgi:predicted transcriptional regulator